MDESPELDNTAVQTRQKRPPLYEPGKEGHYGAIRICVPPPVNAVANSPRARSLPAGKVAFLPVALEMLTPRRLSIPAERRTRISTLVLG